MQPAGEPVRILDWKGLVSNRGKLGAKPGAALVQTNLRCVRPGELSLRNNATELQLGGGSVAMAAAMAPYHGDGADYLIVQTGGSVSALELV